MIVAASFNIRDPEQWNNRALQYGDGLFETMRFHRNEIPLWGLHRNRLIKGMKRLNLDIPDLEQIVGEVKQQCGVRNSVNGVIKLTVFRTFQARSYQAKNNAVQWLATLDGLTHDPHNQSVVLAVADKKLSKQPMLGGIKHLNRLEQVLLANELSQHPEADDLLVLNEHNQIIETTYQNTVMIKDNQIFTPKLKSSGVKGVALQWLKNNFKVKSLNIKLNDLSGFQALMVCNSVRGFKLVSEVRSVNSFVTSHPVHDKIVHQWRQMFNQ